VTRRGPAGLPPQTQRVFDSFYPRWRAARHPQAEPPTSAEFDYLEQALIKTYYVDGGRTDILKQVALEVMDEWVAAGDDPVARRALKKTDFRIR
jgi:hypothetical protein